MDQIIFENEQAAGTSRRSLKDQAREAPCEAGVYIMKDAEGKIIYVGKARVLRNRLSSYFSGEKDIKTAILMRHAVFIETIITAGEYEALLLENTLIKQHSPKYNIKLTDGKTYPVIRLTSGPFSRVFRTRHIVEDGSEYFGPFANISAVDDTLDIIDKTFPLRKCRRLRKRSSPCLYYHIGRCAAPCCGKIDEAGYGLQVERVRKLLSGESAELIADLSGEMNREARALCYERAAALRDAVKAIETLSAASVVVDFDPQGRDYIAWAAEGVLATWSVFSMRGGKLTGRELYPTRSASDEEESLEIFIASYYNESRLPPPRIFIYRPAGKTVEAGSSVEAGLPAKSGLSVKAGAAAKTGPDGLSRIRRWFREQLNVEPELVFCAVGISGGETGAAAELAAKHHAAIIAMVRQNAEEDLRRRLRERGAGPALDELAAVLELRDRPETIEGFDIAQLDGKHPVASLISFKNGIPDRKNYRRFKLRSVVGIVDDFASMREAVERRYSRLLREGKEPPDLILVDGGAGQVSAAKGVLDALGIRCDVAGLAKREEELWLPGRQEPIRLSRRSEALKVLQHLRDETHRFATSLNQKLRSGDLRFGILESVEGIGPARAAALLKAFGSLEAIADADAGNIAAACGLSLAAAKAARAAARLSAEGRKTAAGRIPSRRRPGLAASLAEAALNGSAPGGTADTQAAAEAPPDYGKTEG
ncbi:MAG: excinuclease ABC subunit UvrC [Spirochaetaceae bacterium]|jgi:excinuclease ABC subunit C|nr:excinuclease ABC subunit UvrC [Spirochaetaceae bacterium]